MLHYNLTYVLYTDKPAIHHVSAGLTQARSKYHLHKQPFLYPQFKPGQRNWVRPGLNLPRVHMQIPCELREVTSPWQNDILADSKMALTEDIWRHRRQCYRAARERLMTRRQMVAIYQHQGTGAMNSQTTLQLDWVTISGIGIQNWQPNASGSFLNLVFQQNSDFHAIHN